MQKKKNGFTLIEVLVAVVVFTVTMLYGLSFFVYGQKQYARSKEVLYGLQVAKNKLELEKTRQYDAVISRSWPSEQGPKGVEYTVTETVAEIPESGYNYKGVSMCVEWRTASSNKLESITLHTVMTQ